MQRSTTLRLCRPLAPHRNKTCRSKSPPRRLDQARTGRSRGVARRENREPPLRWPERRSSAAANTWPKSESLGRGPKRGPHRPASTTDKPISATATRRCPGARRDLVSTSGQPSFRLQRIENRALAQGSAAGATFRQRLQGVFHDPQPANLLLDIDNLR